MSNIFGSNVEMAFERIAPMKTMGFGLLALAALMYGVVLIAMLIVALPIGIIGLTALAGVALLFVAVVRDRLNNEEDDYYSRNVQK